MQDEREKEQPRKSPESGKIPVLEYKTKLPNEPMEIQKGDKEKRRK